MPTIDFGQYDLISNVLAQGAAHPVPYQVFTGDELAAYQAVCQKLGVQDLRQEYTNINYAPSTSDLDPQDYPQGASFSLDTWNSVCDVLKGEIYAVSQVRALYGNFSAFNLTVFVDEDATLANIQTDLVIDTSTQVNLAPATFVEGILYTVFSAMGPAASFLANVAATAWNTALAAGQWNPSEQLEVDYASLLSTLLGKWEAVTTTAADQETAILQDWGMTQAVAALCKNQLNVTSAQLAQAQDLGVAQFGTTVLQMMMPAVCAITGTLFGQGTPPAQTSTNWVLQLPNGTWCELSIVVPVDGKFFDKPVQSELMDDYVWAAGVPRQDVFLGQNGWQLPYGDIVVTGWEGSPETDSDSALLVAFINRTGVALTVRSATTPGYSDQQVLVGGEVSIDPGGLAVFCAAYSDGPSMDFSVWYGGYNSSVASCTVSQSVGAWKGGTVAVSNANWVDGYSLASQTMNGTYGTGPNGAPGVAVIDVNFTAAG